VDGAHRKVGRLLIAANVDCPIGQKNDLREALRAGHVSVVISVCCYTTRRFEGMSLSRTSSSAETVLTVSERGSLAM